MKHETKDFRIDIKELSETGTFSGYLSVYDVVDAGNDLVEKGAFAKTINENGSRVPLLWQHNTDEPIGTLALEDSDDGLQVKGTLVDGVGRADAAYKLLKAGVVRGLSIGYRTIQSEMIKGVRHLKEIKLFEGSLVTFPMNPAAVITAVKADEEKAEDFAGTLEQIRLSALREQMLQAMYWTLDDILWSGNAGTDILALTDQALTQFHTAYIEFLPGYLDLRGMKQVTFDETKAGRTISAASRAVIEEAIATLQKLLADVTEPDEADATDEKSAGETATETADNADTETETNDPQIDQHLLTALKDLLNTYQES